MNNLCFLWFLQFWHSYISGPQGSKTVWGSLHINKQLLFSENCSIMQFWLCVVVGVLLQLSKETLVQGDYPPSGTFVQGTLLSKETFVQWHFFQSKPLSKETFVKVWINATFMHTECVSVPWDIYLLGQKTLEWMFLGQQSPWSEPPHHQHHKLLNS